MLLYFVLYPHADESRPSALLATRLYPQLADPTADSCALLPPARPTDFSDNNAAPASLAVSLYSLDASLPHSEYAHPAASATAFPACYLPAALAPTAATISYRTPTLAFSATVSTPPAELCQRAPDAPASRITAAAAASVARLTELTQSDSSLLHGADHNLAVSDCSGAPLKPYHDPAALSATLARIAPLMPFTGSSSGGAAATDASNTSAPGAAQTTAPLTLPPAPHPAPTVTLQARALLCAGPDAAAPLRALTASALSRVRAFLAAGTDTARAAAWPAKHGERFRSWQELAEAETRPLYALPPLDLTAPPALSAALRSPSGSGSGSGSATVGGDSNASSASASASAAPVLPVVVIDYPSLPRLGAGELEWQQHKLKLAGQPQLPQQPQQPQQLAHAAPAATTDTAVVASAANHASVAPSSLYQAHLQPQLTPAEVKAAEATAAAATAAEKAKSGSTKPQTVPQIAPLRDPFAALIETSFSSSRRPFPWSRDSQAPPGIEELARSHLVGFIRDTYIFPQGPTLGFDNALTADLNLGLPPPPLPGTAGTAVLLPDGRRLGSSTMLLRPAQVMPPMNPPAAAGGTTAAGALVLMPVASLDAIPPPLQDGARALAVPQLGAASAHQRSHAQVQGSGAAETAEQQQERLRREEEQRLRTKYPFESKYHSDDASVDPVAAAQRAAAAAAAEAAAREEREELAELSRLSPYAPHPAHMTRLARPAVTPSELYRDYYAAPAQRTGLLEAYLNAAADDTMRLVLQQRAQARAAAVAAGASARAVAEQFDTTEALMTAFVPAFERHPFVQALPPPPPPPTGVWWRTKAVAAVDSVLSYLSAPPALPAIATATPKVTVGADSSASVPSTVSASVPASVASAAPVSYRLSAHYALTVTPDASALPAAPLLPARVAAPTDEPIPVPQRVARFLTAFPTLVADAASVHLTLGGGARAANCVQSPEADTNGSVDEQALTDEDSQSPDLRTFCLSPSLHSGGSTHVRYSRALRSDVSELLLTHEAAPGLVVGARAVGYRALGGAGVVADARDWPTDIAGFEWRETAPASSPYAATANANAEPVPVTPQSLRQQLMARDGRDDARSVADLKAQSCSGVAQAGRYVADYEVQIAKAFFESTPTARAAATATGAGFFSVIKAGVQSAVARATGAGHSSGAGALRADAAEIEHRETLALLSRASPTSTIKAAQQPQAQSQSWRNRLEVPTATTLASGAVPALVIGCNLATTGVAQAVVTAGPASFAPGVRMSAMVEVDATSFRSGRKLDAAFAWGISLDM